MNFKMHANRANDCNGLSHRVCIAGIFTLSMTFGLAVQSQASSVPAGNKLTPDPSPYERRIALPNLFILPPGQSQSFRFEPKAFRLSMVCILGTWNKQSESVHLFYKKHKTFFKERKIATVAVFSHDTRENLDAWVTNYKPDYPVGLAQTEFVDSLKNPKVPTCWLLSQQGQLLKRLVIPSEHDFESVYHNLKLWTDF